MSPARGAHRYNETSGAVAAFRLYTQASHALDAGAVAQHFHEPALLITPEDTVALTTVAAVEETYARLIADLPARAMRGPSSRHVPSVA